MSLVTRVSCVVAAAFCVLAAGALPAGAALKTKAKLLKDINPGTDSSSPNRLVRLGESVYFEAYSAQTGGELWKTDGTRAGTQLVADIAPGSPGSYPRGIRATDRYVFFTVLQSDRTRRLWRTDGTEAGTAPVPGTADLPIGASLTATGHLFFFETYEADSALPRVWATDGDAPPVAIGQGGSFEAATLDGVAYLPLAGPADGEYSLWRTDGTVAGTTPVKSGLGIYGPLGLTKVGGSLYFGGLDSAGPAVWRTDGSASGTVRVGDLPPDVEAYPRATAALGNRFVLMLDGRLWVSDGASLEQLIDSQVAGLQSQPPGARAYAVIHGRLWRTDGTENGTRLVSERPRSAWGFASAGRTTLFTARSRKAHGQRVLWQTDGTDRSTSVIAGLPHEHWRHITSLTSLGDRVAFVAKDRHHGRELFVARTLR